MGITPGQRETLLALEAQDTKSYEVYQVLKRERIRVGTQDLRIVSITLARDGVLLTRNLQDFKRVPGLSIQDWSVYVPQSAD